MKRTHSVPAYIIESMESRRLLAAGSPDAAFGSGGTATLAFGGFDFNTYDTALQADGKVVISGSKGNSAGIARLNLDGSTDTTFGSNGLVERTSIRRADVVGVQSDGKIVVAGTVDSDTIGALRLNTDGTPDASFGVNGLARFEFSSYTVNVNDMVIQRDGKILLTGEQAEEEFVTYNHNMFVVRLNTDGTPDSTFDGDGGRLIEFGGYDVANGIAVDYNFTPATNQLYGSIVVVGVRFEEDDDRLAIARLTPTGALDNNFDGNGQLTAVFPGGQSVGHGVVIQSLGRIVVVGSHGATDETANFLTARFNSNGALDLSFAGAGYSLTDFNSADVALEVGIGYQNNLVVAGASGTLSSGRQLAAAVFTPDGQLDTRFDVDGKRLYGGVFAHNTSLAITGSTVAPIRRIVIAGGPNRVVRFEDVGPLVTVTALDTEASEPGTNTARFRVTRDAAATTDRIFFDVSGTARRPGITGPIGITDYSGTNIVFDDALVGNRPYVTLAAGVFSVDVTITPFDDTLVEGDETAIFNVAANNAYAAGTPASFTMAIRDNDVSAGPTVTSGYAFESIPTLTFRFNQNVAATFAASDIQFTGPSNRPASTFAYNATTNTGTLTFAAALPDGNYTATIAAASVTNTAGQPMASSHTVAFFALSGDANRDRAVNFDDLLVLAQNYGQAGRTFSQGDFNYDDAVNFDDLLILAQRYGSTLPGLSSPNVVTTSVKKRERASSSDYLT